ncbi:Adi1 [Kluyveromyces lactis]|nr:Adi1 [Kluyveromyces lactis]
MVKVYIHDNDSSVDFREDHDTGKPVSLERLEQIGLIYRKFDTQEEVDQFAQDRDYKNRDIVNITVNSFPDEETMISKLNVFYAEHLHEDEEIRYCLDGEGFFDVRDPFTEEWIRCRVQKGDLLVLPAGIYHRFTLTSDNYIKALRLFKEEPKWLAYNKPDADDNRYRQEYLTQVGL